MVAAHASNKTGGAAFDTGNAYVLHLSTSYKRIRMNSYSYSLLHHVLCVCVCVCSIIVIEDERMQTNVVLEMGKLHK